MRTMPHRYGLRRWLPLAAFIGLVVMAAGTIESVALGLCDKRACPSSVVSDAFGVAAVLGLVVVVAASLG